MNKIYDKLEYVGNAHFVNVAILPKRVSVQLDKDHPYVFKDSDSLDEKAIKYYESMKRLGIVLHKVDDQNLVSTPALQKVEEVKPEPVVEEIPPVVEEPQVEEEVDPELEEVEKSQDEEVTEEINEADNAELIEFLDLNYDEEALKSLAKDAGIKRVQSSWSKSELINKIIATNSDYVVNLMQSNS